MANHIVRLTNHIFSSKTTDSNEIISSRQDIPVQVGRCT